jgi:hypothetical protein
MNSILTASLALVGFAALVETVLAGPTAGVPGPIVGVGLPAGGAYWVGRKLFGRKE